MVRQQAVEDGSDFLLFATFLRLRLNLANAGVEEEEEEDGCNERRHFEVADEALISKWFRQWAAECSAEGAFKGRDELRKRQQVQPSSSA